MKRLALLIALALPGLGFAAPVQSNQCGCPCCPDCPDCPDC